MPRSITYRPEIIEELISARRIASYLNVFQHADDAELVGAYLWNAHVCASFYPLLQMFEVSLRNAIDKPLSTPGRSWWASGILRYNSHGGPIPNVVNSINKNFASARDKVIQDKRRRYRVRTNHATHEEILAKTDFSTWEFLLDPEFMGPGLIWPTHLGRVFRGNWGGQSPSQILTYTRDTIRSIRMFRNRVFHHEPAWKHAGIHNEVDAVAYLRGKVDQIKSMLDLIHPEQLKLAEKSLQISALERACSIADLKRFKLQATHQKVATKHKLETLLRTCAATNEAVLIKTYGTFGRKFLILPA